MNYPDQEGVKAVKTVKKERLRAGLPEDPVEEAIEIEKRLDPSNVDLKKEPELDLYWDTQCFGRKVADKMWAEKVARKLVNWAVTTKTALKINEFFQEENIWYKDFYRLKKKFEILDRAHDIAMRAIGDHRERGMMEKKYDASVGMYMQGLYDPEWKAEQDRRDSLRVRLNSVSPELIMEKIKELTTRVDPTDEVRERLKERGLLEKEIEVQEPYFKSKRDKVVKEEKIE